MNDAAHEIGQGFASATQPPQVRHVTQPTPRADTIDTLSILHRALRVVVLCALIAIANYPTGLASQDLEPRAFSNAPVGMNFLTGVYSYSTGNVLLETALPLEDVTARLNIIQPQYFRVINFFGLSSKVDVTVPFSWGTWKGKLAGQDSSVSRTGLGDAKVRWAVNILGAPALRGAEFFKWKQKTIVGASVQVLVPIGQYNPDLLINLGSNRWSFKTRVGVSQRIQQWILEGIAAAWFFTPNNNFFGGNRLTQDPIWAGQVNIGYVFKPGLWLALNAGYGTGGSVTVSGVSQSQQKNTRLGVVFAVPVDAQNLLRFVYISGLSTRLGADFDTFGAGYVRRWGGLPKREAGGER